MVHPRLVCSRQTTYHLCHRSGPYFHFFKGEERLTSRNAKRLLLTLHSGLMDLGEYTWMLETNQIGCICHVITLPAVLCSKPWTLTFCFKNINEQLLRTPQGILNCIYIIVVYYVSYYYCYVCYCYVIMYHRTYKINPALMSFR